MRGCEASLLGVKGWEWHVARSGRTVVSQITRNAMLTVQSLPDGGVLNFFNLLIPPLALLTQR
jgi:hypothetical protein